MSVVVTGLAAFAGGVLISWVNYRLLLRLIRRRGSEGVTFAAPVRTVLSAAYLLLLFLLAGRTELSTAALLIGGAVGLTGALFYFTLRLTRKGSGGKE